MKNIDVTNSTCICNLITTHQGYEWNFELWREWRRNDSKCLEDVALHAGGVRGILTTEKEE